MPQDSDGSEVSLNQNSSRKKPKFPPITIFELNLRSIGDFFLKSGLSQTAYKVKLTQHGIKLFSSDMKQYNDLK